MHTFNKCLFRFVLFSRTASNKPSSHPCLHADVVEELHGEDAAAAGTIGQALRAHIDEVSHAASGYMAGEWGPKHACHNIKLATRSLTRESLRGPAL